MLWRPLKDSLSAVSVCLTQGKVGIDPSYKMDVEADVDFNVVMTGSGLFVEVQGTAEGKVFDQKELSRMLLAARHACKKIQNRQKKVLKSFNP